MSGCRIFGMFVVVGLLMSTAPAVAHHAAQSQFDLNKAITLEGTCLKFAWFNPHAYMDMSVEDESGKATVWRLETVRPPAFRSAGLARGGAIPCSPRGGGDTYVMRGFPARDGSDVALVVDLKLPDGRIINLFGANTFRLPKDVSVD
jgi:hypothetical protein